MGKKNCTRRTFVGAAAGTAALLAGCSKPEDGATPDTDAAAENDAAQADSDQETGSGGRSNKDVSTADGSLARPSKNGRLTVQGARLVDASGNPAQLKGFSTHGLAWFPQYVNAECFAELSGWGADVARLALYTHENGGYCTDGDQASLRALIEKGVACAADADMYCIVDWHVLQDLDPNVYLDQAKEFWGWASERFADANNVLYEICNEPNGATTWADVKRYAEAVLPVIRANDPGAAVIVGTPNWSQKPDDAAADPLSDEHVLYALHFYAATHKDDLRAALRSTVEGGAPVFVSEYGICDASGNGGLDLDSANTWVALMDELGVCSCCWSLCNKAESASFIASSCEKTSGFEDEDLTPCGLWVKSMLAGEVVSEVAGSDGTGSGAGSLTLESIAGGDGVDAAASLRQSWETDGKPYLLYDVSISADSAASSWEAILTFSASVALSDSWNCTAAVDGAVVTLTPASYNASVAAGASISDVGLIVYPA